MLEDEQEKLWGEPRSQFCDWKSFFIAISHHPGFLWKNKRSLTVGGVSKDGMHRHMLSTIFMPLTASVIFKTKSVCLGGPCRREIQP
jgi:hypothetical protein